MLQAYFFARVVIRMSLESGMKIRFEKCLRRLILRKVRYGLKFFMMEIIIISMRSVSVMEDPFLFIR